MLKIYRNLLDILLYSSDSITKQFTSHIRDYNNGEQTGDNFETKGYWNFLLEIVFIVFVYSFTLSAILLCAAMAVVFFPLNALKISILNIMNYRATSFEQHE